MNFDSYSIVLKK